ncbi:MAG: response regulator [Candidatus Omnitrophica bacterium]|nr:response regulator [Candidatus Omnitrophota bacterium]
MEILPPKILLIEDDQDTQILLKENLKKAGYQVIGVGTGEEGLTAFKKHKPDLVILDVGLPGIDGWEVLRRIKSGPFSRKTPVLMLTARSETADKVKGYEIGADFYIAKPFNTQKLLMILRSMLADRPDRSE